MPTMPITNLPIHELIPQVMRSIGVVGKGDTNTFHKFNFRGIDSVVNHVYPALVEHGVFIVPHVDEVRTETVQTSQGKPAQSAIVTVTYNVYGPTGDHITARMTGEAMDSGDKAVPKALSIAFKYLMFQLFTIPTEGQDDPDGQVYERVERGLLAELRQRLGEMDMALDTGDAAVRPYLESKAGMALEDMPAHWLTAVLNRTSDDAGKSQFVDDVIAWHAQAAGE